MVLHKDKKLREFADLVCKINGRKKMNNKEFFDYQKKFDQEHIIYGFIDTYKTARAMTKIFDVTDTIETKDVSNYHAKHLKELALGRETVLAQYKEYTPFDDATSDECRRIGFSDYSIDAAKQIIKEHPEILETYSGYYNFLKEECSTNKQLLDIFAVGKDLFPDRALQDPALECFVGSFEPVIRSAVSTRQIVNENEHILGQTFFYYEPLELRELRTPKGETLTAANKKDIFDYLTFFIYRLYSFSNPLHYGSIKKKPELLKMYNALRVVMSVLTNPYSIDAAAEEENARGQRQVEQQLLFPDVYGIPPTTKDVKFMVASKAAKNVIKAFANLKLNKGSIYLLNRDEEVIQTLDLENRGQPEDALTEFDNQIRDAVGSLMTKYKRSWFSDIEIAKEFRATQDKKCHITPESEIVAKVQASIQRQTMFWAGIDVTRQIELLKKKRHPDQAKIDKLEKNVERYKEKQPLLNVLKEGVRILKSGKETKVYEFAAPPLLYTQAAAVSQIDEIPMVLINPQYGRLSDEQIMLRALTIQAVRTGKAMFKNWKARHSNKILFDTLLDKLLRTSKDDPKADLVKTLPRYQKKRYIDTIKAVLPELAANKEIASFKITTGHKGKSLRNIEDGFIFSLKDETETINLKPDKKEKPTRKI